MDNEYLWNKTGEDKEIEYLENALKSLRYKPIAPPQLPAKVLQLEEKPKFSFFPKVFRFAIAGFGCVAIGFVSATIWLNTSNNKIEDIGAYSQPLVEPIKIDAADSPAQTKPQIFKLVDKKPLSAKSSSLPKIFNVTYRQKMPKPKPIKVVQLTKEERDAYNQLILALSITSSQLKEVKNKVNGIEETTANINSLR